MGPPHSIDTSVIRAATFADLDSVVEVVRSSMPLDPGWNYCYEHAHEFPEDSVRFTQLLFQHFIDPGFDDWHVMVADAPSLHDPNVTKIVAFAVWDVSYRNKRKHGSTYVPQNPYRNAATQAVAEAGGSARRDMNQKREAAFRDALSKGRPSFFKVYGDDQIWLESLGTHPDYMRRGFGAALVKWGIQVAKEDHLVVSLVASPMGALLYAHLGFQTLGQIVLQAPEETEKFFLKATVLLVEEEEPAKQDL